MKSLVVFFTLLFIAVIQSSFLPFVFFKTVKPNLVLVIGLFCAVIFTGDLKWWIVFFAGFLADFFSGLPFGLGLLSFVVSFYLVFLFKKNIFGQLNLRITLVLVGFGTLVYIFLLLVMNSFWSGYNFLAYRSGLVLTIFAELFYNLLSGIFFYYVWQKIQNKS